MGKISPEEKIQWIKKIIQNKESVSSVAAKTGVHYMTVDKWLRNYKSIGQDVFFRKGLTKRTAEEKEAAVLDYLSGIGSLRDICDKYKFYDLHYNRFSIFFQLWVVRQLLSRSFVMFSHILYGNVIDK